MDGPKLAARRKAAGLTQAELAALSGIRQSNLSAYESGARRITPAVEARVRPHVGVRPSEVLARHRDQIVQIARDHGAVSVRVFGSVARGEDTLGSDLDLLVRLVPGTSIFTFAELPELLTELTGVRVDVVSEGGLLPRDEHILAEAVAL